MEHPWMFVAGILLVCLVFVPKLLMTAIEGELRDTVALFALLGAVVVGIWLIEHAFVP